MRGQLQRVGATNYGWSCSWPHCNANTTVVMGACLTPPYPAAFWDRTLSQTTQPRLSLNYPFCDNPIQQRSPHWNAADDHLLVSRVSALTACSEAIQRRDADCRRQIAVAATPAALFEQVLAY